MYLWMEEYVEEMRRWRWRRGIKTLRRKDNKNLWRRGKIEEGNVVREDSLLSVTILIYFFQIAVYLTLFVLKRYLVSDFIASNY